MGIVSAKKLWIGLLGAVFVCPSAALAQNDWQSPDPYFGAFQHRQAGTPEAERRYRAEIAPQLPSSRNGCTNNAQRRLDHSESGGSSPGAVLGQSRGHDFMTS